MDTGSGGSGGGGDSSGGSHFSSSGDSDAGYLESKIKSILYGILISGLATAYATITGAFSVPFMELQTALSTSGRAVQMAFYEAGLSVLIVVNSISGSLEAAAYSAGIAAPITTAIIFAIGAVFTLALIRGAFLLIRNVPII